jgi:hypothetical protein
MGLRVRFSLRHRWGIVDLRASSRGTMIKALSLGVFKRERARAGTRTLVFLGSSARPSRSHALLATFNSVTAVLLTSTAALSPRGRHAIRSAIEANCPAFTERSEPMGDDENCSTTRYRESLSLLLASCGGITAVDDRTTTYPPTPLQSH